MTKKQILLLIITGVVLIAATILIVLFANGTLTGQIVGTTK